ncbi:MAG: hypothetical protein LBB40_03185 [Holophagales bacterium]|nr:hypothetical protein [Holophagales bacterium]
MVLIALPCVFAAEPPLTLDQVLAKSKVSITRLNIESALADVRRQAKDASGFMRDSPSVSVVAGPRTNSVAPASTDQAIEIDAPLMLKREPARQLTSLLDSVAAVLYNAADLENSLAIHQAFLNAWLAERIETIRAEDHILVQIWLEISRTRSESGADPAFQLDLVRGELLKSRLDWEDAKRTRIQSWNVLKSLSELPERPQPLDYFLSKEVADISDLKTSDMVKLYQNGALRRASIARQSLEMSRINLQAAVSDSRWSISGSYAKENDDRITKIGIAYKFPRSGELSAIRAEQRVRIETSKRNAELALADLDLRFAAAIQTVESNKSYSESLDTAASLEALTLRLKEGKDQPSDVIPIRRQFMEIRIAELRRSHSLSFAYAELLTLTAGNMP